MKKVLFCFLLAFACSYAYGQRIHFTDTVNSWKVHLAGGAMVPYSVVHTYRFTKDTVIDGKGYKIMNGTSVNRLIVNYPSYPPMEAATYFFREDSLDGKLWIRPKGKTVDSLVYDRSWDVGDIIRTNAHGNVVVKWFIKRVDSTQIDGQWYKVFWVRGTDSTTGSVDYFSIIEGVGSTAGLNYMYSFQVGGWSAERLLCFNRNNTTPVMNPDVKNIYTHIHKGFANTGPCDVPMVNLTLHVKAIQRNEPSFYPNPATQDSRIRLPHAITHGVLYIHNSAGQEVSRTAISKSSELILPDMLHIPGMYVYRITDLDRSVSYGGRFIIK